MRIRTRILSEPPSPSPLASVLRGRLALIELALAAIVLALAVQFGANAFSAILSPSPKQTLFMALALSVVGILLFVWRVITLRTYTGQYKGTFVYSKDSEAIVDVPDYFFGTELATILNAAFAENPALEAQWKAGAPGSRFRLPGINKKNNQAQIKAAKLVEEAAEYLVLEVLSTHLTDYFNHLGNAEKKTVQLRRDQVPDVLLNNRILSLLSTPMEDRQAFVKDNIPKPHSGEIVAAFSGGTRYSRFDLVLPKNSRVTRTESGAVQISTPRLKFTFQVRYDGFAAGVPFTFCSFYLGAQRIQLDTQLVFVGVEVALKMIGLLFSKWDYYRWIDSFLTTLEHQLSFEAFLARINWPTIAGLLRCEDVRRNSTTKDG